MSETSMSETTLLDQLCERHWTVIPIFFYGRSGSYFFGSLLDNHPELMMWPPGSLLHILSVPWSEERFEKMSVSECLQIHKPIIQRACHPIESGDDTKIAPFGSVELTKMGENRNESALLDPKIFGEAIDQVFAGVKSINRREWFIAIHTAYWLALGNKIEDLPENPKIVHHIHYWNDGLLGKLSRDFPDLKIIHTVRRPVQAYASHIKHTINPTEHARRSCIPMIVVFLFGGRSILEAHHTNTRVVRLEDLNNRPEQTMLEVCKFLGIQWDPCLLRSTTNGKLRYETPGGSSEAYTGFHNNALKRSISELISEDDEARLEAFVSHYYDAWEYERKGDMSLVQAANMLKKPYKFLEQFPQHDWDGVYERMQTYLDLLTKKRLHRVIRPIIPDNIQGQLI